MKLKVYCILLSTLSFTAGCRWIGKADRNSAESTTHAAVADTTSYTYQEIQIRQETDNSLKDSEGQRAAQPTAMSKLNEGSKAEMIDEMEEVQMSFSQTYQQVSSQRTQRTPSLAQQQLMDENVQLLAKSAPASFEYHLYSYISGNYDLSLIEHLKTAEKLNPSNMDVQLQMAAYYIVKDDTKNAEIYLQKLIDRNRFSNELLNYAEDLLLSVKANGTLITHGFDDTFPLVYLQLKKGVRADVAIISLDLLQSQSYRSRLMVAGYKISNETFVDVKYFQNFLELNTSKNLAVSMTVPKEYVKDVQARLFPSGLVFDYSLEKEYSNFYRNELLWNKELQRKSLNQPALQQTKALNANYLPMLFQLRGVYLANNQLEQLSEVDKWIDNIAIQCNKYEQVQKLKGAN
jgi:hypothetical protein